MTKWMIILGLLLSTATLFAQNKVFGAWEGVITQNEGGYRSEYILNCSFIQDGEDVIGRTFIFVDDIFVEMEVKGKLYSDVLLNIEDIKIIDSDQHEGMEWCLKKYQLVLKKTGNRIELEGHWQGHTTFSDCIPGKVKLVQKLPRA